MAKIILLLTTVLVLFASIKLGDSCVQSDRSIGGEADGTSWYYTNHGRRIVDMHNKLRRRKGVPDIKWSGKLEYAIWEIMADKKASCSHSGTRAWKPSIIDPAGEGLQCSSQRYMENIAIKYDSAVDGVQGWIDEEGTSKDGHYRNMINRGAKYVGCWTEGTCFKCIYWGEVI